MKKFYLIDATTMLAVHAGSIAPILENNKVVCEDETYLCYTENNSLVAECEEVADFAQHKYRLVGNNLLLDPAWVGPDNSGYIAKRKAEIWEDIKSYRDNRILTGGYPVGTHWFHSDLIMRSQLLVNARKADKIEATGGDLTIPMVNVEGEIVQVKTMDNGYIAISAQLAIDTMDAIEVHEMATYKAAVTHKYLLYLSTDPDSYDWRTNWPLIYGET